MVNNILIKKLKNLITNQIVYSFSWDLVIIPIILRLGLNNVY